MSEGAKKAARQFVSDCIDISILNNNFFFQIGSLLHAITLSQATDVPEFTNSTQIDELQIDSGSNTGTILISIFMFCISVALVIGVYQVSEAEFIGIILFK